MSFTLKSNSSKCVITSIGGMPNGGATFTITGGTFPLYSGDTITGTNTAITNNFDEYFGAPNGQIYFFMEGGNCQVEVYINGTIYSSGDYGSGYNTLTVPILKSSDVIRIDFDRVDSPSPFPSPTPTPSKTAAPTATPTPTPSVTPSSSPIPHYPFLQIAGFYPADGVSNISSITGNIYLNGQQLTNKIALPDGTVQFSGGSFTYGGTGSTISFTLSANPQGSFAFADDGIVGGTYNIQYLTGFTYWKTTTTSGVVRDIFTGTTSFYSGTTNIGYSEPGKIQFNKTSNVFEILSNSPNFETGYFNILPV